MVPGVKIECYNLNVTILKTLWASIELNPTVMRKFNGWATIACIILIPVSLLFGWTSSVEYVSALSIWALVTGHLSAWQAARVEEKQDEQNNGESTS